MYTWKLRDIESHIFTASTAHLYNSNWEKFSTTTKLYFLLLFFSILINLNS